MTGLTVAAGNDYRWLVILSVALAGVLVPVPWRWFSRWKNHLDANRGLFPRSRWTPPLPWSHRRLVVLMALVVAIMFGVGWLLPTQYVFVPIWVILVVAYIRFLGANANRGAAGQRHNRS
jgi:hypothetical protein